MQQPIAKEIPYKEPIEYVLALDPQNGLVFLDSAKLHNHYGRFSFIAFSPFLTLTYQGNQIFLNEKPVDSEDIFGLLSNQLSIYSLKPISALPPFQGGLAGFFSYDLGRDLEKLPSHAINDKNYPLLMLGLYDIVLSFDHFQKRAWIISSGLPEEDLELRKKRANQRLEWCENLLKQPVVKKFPSEPIVSLENIVSNFSEKTYIQAVKKIIGYILAGDIFEANLSQRFECKLSNDVMPLDLYQRIRKLNPAPFSAYLKFKDISIVSSSPERFLKLYDRKVEARPIKGTIKRSMDLNEDIQLAQTLLSSAKDKAENTMIVDLMRNDLSKVCKPHTVKVPQLCGLESFETVHHLVSVVNGELEAEYGPVDLLKSSIPGGSITGAPKIRAMEIIDELEPTRRGPYCGNVGYIGFDGCMDTSILIRSYVVDHQSVTFQAGGAVVLDSDPKTEYEETLLKIKVLKQALTEKIDEEVEEFL